MLTSALNRTKEMYKEVKRGVKEQRELMYGDSAHSAKHGGPGHGHEPVSMKGSSHHKKSKSPKPKKSTTKSSNKKDKNNDASKKKRKKKLSRGGDDNSSMMFMQHQPSIRNNLAGARTSTGDVFRCAGCNNSKGDARLGFVHVLDQQYHTECLNCASCKKLINPQTELSYVVDEDTGKPQPIHINCYGDMLAMKCCVCSENIPTNPTSGTVEFRAHAFFTSEKMCPKHDHSLTPPGVTKVRRCNSCSRYECEAMPFETLDDGKIKRGICKACCRTIPMKVKSDIMPLWDQVTTFFGETLKLKVDDDMKSIKIKIVKQDKLMEQMKECGVHEASDEGHARGLCISELSSNGQAKVRTILCLRGLPRDLTASVLAHEATHAWIKLYHPESHPIPPQVEEGMCQLMSFLFLQHLPPLSKKDDTKYKRKSDKGPTDKELRKYFMYEIENDSDVVYGDGFRMAHKVYEKCKNVKQIMTYIVRSKTFPEI